VLVAVVVGMGQVAGVLGLGVVLALGNH